MSWCHRDLFMWTNGNHHRVAAKKKHHVEHSRPATSVHGLVLAVRRARTMMRLYHAVSVDALVGLDFASGWENGDRNHSLRDEPMRSVLRVEDRMAAMQSSRPITSTSTMGGEK